MIPKWSASNVLCFNPLKSKDIFINNNNFAMDNGMQIIIENEIVELIPTLWIMDLVSYTTYIVHANLHT